MDIILVFIVLLLAIVLFVWGRFRHDIVAIMALLAMVFMGLVPAEEAFAGFGHPAVITVAVVLVIGKALEHSGLIDLLGKWVSRVGQNLTLQVATLCFLVALASAFMNNVGALAILMPVALSIAKKNKTAPSNLLMPIAFASLLGGMITLIGTPPNIIIASLRASEVGEPFGMFDFSAVGIALSVVGILFISLVGWRLLPSRMGQRSLSDSFRIKDYITELRVSKQSKAIGYSIIELMQRLKLDVQILGIVRNNRRMHAPDSAEQIMEEDILILESDTESLRRFVDETRTDLVGDEKLTTTAAGSQDIVITEAIVMQDSLLIGQSTSGLSLRRKYGINLLAVSRKSKKIYNRLDHIMFQPGDVIMIQGYAQTLSETVITIGCIPLAQRSLKIGFEKRILMTLSIFLTSIALVIAGILPVHISFTLAAVGVVISGVLPLKELYQSIDWPVIVLLGAMLPVGHALETSGGADLIAQQILSLSGVMPVWFIMSLLMAITMLLSGVINNAATVVLMAPIGIGLGHGMNASIDPFLMVIAIGASASFLTPIGHQSNTLVMGPGGYHFGDYFRMGLPMSIITIAVAVPMILYIWPL